MKVTEQIANLLPRRTYPLLIIKVRKGYYVFACKEGQMQLYFGCLKKYKKSLAEVTLKESKRPEVRYLVSLYLEEARTYIPIRKDGTTYPKPKIYKHGS
jgi:hypothetical protein